MSWFFEMREKYAPDMTPVEFDVFINELEMILFTEHPEYLDLNEKEQNAHVEECIRKNIQ